MKRVLAAAVGLVMALLAGCSGNATSSGDTGSDKSKTEAPAKSYAVNVATATTGGAYYPIGNAIAQVWSDKVPGVKASAQATNGTPHNLQLMQKKDAEVAIAQNAVVYQAVTGTGTYQQQGKQTHFKAANNLYPNAMHWLVRKDSGIKSLADLKGKRLVPGATNSATEVNSREMLGVVGLDYRDRKDVKVDYLDYSQAAEQLKNRQADAVQIGGGLPTAAVMDAMSSGDAVLLSLPDDYIKTLTTKYPWYFPMTIPKGTYQGQDADVKTVAVSNMLLVRNDLPDDLVYKLVKALYENADRLAQAHTAMKDFRREDGLNGITGVVDLHPGAAKYFKEIGVLK